MLVPYYWQDDITLYHGDCAEVLPKLDAGSVDLVFTDPPYLLSNMVDIPFTTRADMIRDFGEWDRQWTPDLLLAESARLLVPGGSLLSFTSDKLLSWFAHEGLKHRGTVAWEKSNPPPQPRPGYMSALEFIAWLQKPGAPATWNGNGAQRNILKFPICSGEERTEHRTQKPLALIKDLILRHSDPGDLILDPYVGSGTTLRAAKDLGRRAVGIELREDFCVLTVKRLGQDVLNFS